MINHDQDCGVTSGVRQVLDEVHGDGVPRALWDRQLLKGSIGLVALRLRSFASGARVAIVLNKGAHVRPEVFLMNKGQSLVLTEMS